ncbi:MAG TPA: gamma-glutamyltransferase [Anaeromyxobacter sp.]
MRTQETPPREPQQAAVSTAFPLATEAAVGILRRGGNAVDAAVAAGWALSVCEPSASGLGGQATALLRLANGDLRVVDGHSHAPRRASLSSIGPDEQRRGHRSCTIPSMPATLEHLHRRHGRLPWREVLAPAASIAERGFAVTDLLRRQTQWVARFLREDPAASALFLRNGEPPRAGEILRQPRLGETLHRIAELGAGDLYHGSMARDVADDMREHGGLVDEEDLARFSGPVEREPLSAPYRGFEVASVPPPGGGVQLLVALKLLEHLLPRCAESTLEEWYAAIALSTYGAFEMRELFPIPPQAMTPSVQAYLLSEERAAEIAETLRRGVRGVHGPVEEPGDTTHLTVADADGNVVALTQSIQSVFGAKVANAKLGFLYNNYLRTCPRHPHPSQLGPNSRARSNASPALVLERTEGGTRPVLALGSAGSRRITSSLLQVTSNVVDRGMAIGEAIDALRIHALLSGRVWMENRIALPGLVEWLRQHFLDVVTKGARSFAMGAVHALQFLPGATLAGADPRRDGAAATLPRTEGR